MGAPYGADLSERRVSGRATLTAQNKKITGLDGRALPGGRQKASAKQSETIFALANSINPKLIPPTNYYYMNFLAFKLQIYEDIKDSKSFIFILMIKS